MNILTVKDRLKTGGAVDLNDTTVALPVERYDYVKSVLEAISKTMGFEPSAMGAKVEGDLLRWHQHVSMFL